MRALYTAIVVMLFACTAVVTGQDIESGLVAYYKLNGDGIDTSDFERDLENYGAMPGADRFGNENGAMVFNGENGTYMETIFVDGLPEEDFDRTLCAWLSPDTSTMPRAGVFIAYGTQEDYKHCHINIRPVDGGTFRYGFWGKNIDAHFQTLDPEWVHIVAVLSNSNQATIYINGEIDTLDVIADEEIPDTYLGAETLTIGAHNGNHPSKFSGSLDEIRIYNRALSADDVKALYEFGSTDVQDHAVDLAPTNFELHQNYPNPFNPETTIEFVLPNQQHVTVDVYDVSGKKVRTLGNQLYASGRHRVIWDGLDQNEQPVPSGVYLYRLHAGTFVQTRSMALIR